jgi:hypothetical protein
LNIKIHNYKDIAIWNRMMIIEDMINHLRLLIICVIIKMIIFRSKNNKTWYFQRHFISKTKNRTYLVLQIICIEIQVMVNIKVTCKNKKIK